MAKSLSVQEQATAIGLNLRTLQRYRAAGLPKARPGEGARAWGKRAEDWLAANRQRTGPKPAPPTGTEADDFRLWDTRFRKARAIEKTMAIEQLRGKLHSIEDCEREQALRLLELRSVLMALPTKMAARLMHAESPEFIRATIEEEIRQALEQLTREGSQVLPPTNGHPVEPVDRDDDDDDA